MKMGNWSNQWVEDKRIYCCWVLAIPVHGKRRQEDQLVSYWATQGSQGWPELHIWEPIIKNKTKNTKQEQQWQQNLLLEDVRRLSVDTDWPSTLFSLRSFCVGSFHSTLSESGGCTIMTPGTSLIICCLNQDEAAPRLFYSSSETVLLLNSISAL